MGSALLLRGLNELPVHLRQGCLTIGNFDGVHRGHAVIVHHLVARAASVSGPPIVLSFDPHPAHLLRPGGAPPPLTGPERKAHLLGTLGVAALIVYPTTLDVLQLEPEQFFQRIIVERLQARAIVEGPNFYFGRDRAGTVDLLAGLCRAAGVDLEIVRPLLIGDQYVSSSRIRQLILAGQVHEASQLLARPHRVRGRVVVGAARGRTLGFPTANLEPGGMILPPPGVYAGRAYTQGHAYPAAIHLGPNPTFADQQLKFEIHLIGFQGDLYQQPLEVEFLERLRTIRPFADIAALKRQLREDVARVTTFVHAESAASHPEQPT